MLAWDQVVEQIPPIAVLKTQDRKKREVFICIECLIHNQDQNVSQIQIYCVHVQGSRNRHHSVNAQHLRLRALPIPVY
jgi:hypothetical protein